MNQNRRGFVVIFTVLVASALFGWIYGPSVRATSTSAEDNQSSVREFTTVLDVVQANYAEPVDVDKKSTRGQSPECCACSTLTPAFLMPVSLRCSVKTSMVSIMG